jgi:hypothetical protein
MDHVVYLDTKVKELEKVLSGQKTMIIRGATGRKMPYGRVDTGDALYFIENDGSGQIKAKAVTVSVMNSDKLTREESTALVEKYQKRLLLTHAQVKRWSGKRYIVLIEIAKAEKLTPFGIDKSDYSNMDDWLPVGNIETIRISDQS